MTPGNVCVTQACIPAVVPSSARCFHSSRSSLIRVRHCRVEVLASSKIFLFLASQRLLRQAASKTGQACHFSFSKVSSTRSANSKMEDNLVACSHNPRHVHTASARQQHSAICA